jgi:NAD(P)-dependent dehydrogenase (short-subunit alcohol dehydrogenase family)
MKSKGHEVIGIPCNVGNKTQLSNLVEETIKILGHVDIAVGNAAINPHYGSSMKIPDEIFSKVMKTNIQSNLWLAQLVSPGMKERTDGSIIYISSIGGLRGSDVIGTYGISKAADMQLTRNLAIELGPSNIRVNCIAPGLVKTDFARALWEDPHYAEPRIASTPLRRFGKPEDISGAAVYLASNAGGWITGQTIVIDGGVTITV